MNVSPSSARRRGDAAKSHRPLSAPLGSSGWVQGERNRPNQVRAGFTLASISSSGTTHALCGPRRRVSLARRLLVTSDTGASEMRKSPQLGELLPNGLSVPFRHLAPVAPFAAMPATLLSHRDVGVLPLVPFPLALARFRKARTVADGCVKPIANKKLPKEEPTRGVALKWELLLRSCPIIRARQVPLLAE
jgi:hypothetical protein